MNVQVSGSDMQHKARLDDFIAVEVQHIGRLSIKRLIIPAVWSFSVTLAVLGFSFGVYAFWQHLKNGYSYSQIVSSDIGPISSTGNSLTAEPPTNKKATPSSSSHSGSVTQGANSDNSTSASANSLNPGSGSGGSSGGSGSSTGGTGGGSTSQPPSSPSPTSQTSNCLTKPSACGFPDATNTGVPAGVALRSSGSLKLDQDNQVIDGYLVNGSVSIYGKNVVIKNSKIINTSNPNMAVRIYSGGSVTIEDSEIDGGPASLAIGYGSYTLRRVNVYGGADNLRLGGNTYIYDSYLHDCKRQSGSHDDSTQIIGGSNVVVQHNTVMTFSGAPAGSWPGSGDPMNAALMIGNLTGNINNLLFDNNLVDGGNYTFNVNWTSVDAGTYTATNIRITNNRIGRDFRYGPKSHISHGIVWSGNVWDDNGTTV